MVGDDCGQEGPEARKTFRISRMRGEIKFATRRERDFRIPADFNVTAYRDRKPWQLEREPAGVARLAVSADDTWLVNRLYGGHGDLEEHEDGSATLTTEYSNLEALSQAVLLMEGRMQPLEPDELVAMVQSDLDRLVALHTGDPSQPAKPSRGRAAVDDAPGVLSRTQGPVAPERFALLQALLAFLLERCGDESSATVSSADMRDRFHLSQQELQEHLDLLNLVNFGGGCYAVYCSTQNGSILVDKELYGDTFRRPARLSPLEAKALLRALDVVAPVLAAEAHSSLQTVRDKIAGAFGQYTLSDTPEPQGGDEESAVTTLNEGVRQQRLVRIGYHSRSSDEFSTRVIEPYLLRRDQRGWYVEAYDRSKDGRRTFKVSYVRDAELLDESLRAARGDGRPAPGAGRRGGHRPRAVRAGTCPLRARGPARRDDADRRLGPGRRQLRLAALAGARDPEAPRPRRGARPAARARERAEGRAEAPAVAQHRPDPGLTSTLRSATRAFRCRWRPSLSGM